MTTLKLSLTLLSVLLLTACGVFKPRYVPAACLPQWQIPAQASEPAQGPAAIENLNKRLQTLAQQLGKQAQPVSTTPAK